MPKLVKNTKVVKLSMMRGSVQSTFRHALNKAHKQGWTKVIIIGEGKDGGNTSWSRLSDNVILGLLEKAKTVVIKAFIE